MSEREPDLIVSALTDLLSSEGWQLLREQAIHEWGATGYGARMKEALSRIPAGPDRAYELARVAEEVDATSNAVNALVAWPSEEIKRRTAQKEPSTLWRRPRMRG